MNKTELSKAFKMYEENQQYCVDNGDLSLFWGFGLPDFKPVHCLLRDVARLIGWQCACMDGTYDMVALNEIAKLGRTRFIIID